MPADFVAQLVRTWKGLCLHVPVGLCGACARIMIREALEEAERIARNECHPACPTAALIAAVRGKR